MDYLLILGAGKYAQVIKEIACAMHCFDRIAFLDDEADAGDVIGRCADYKRLVGAFHMLLPAFDNGILRIQWLNRLEKAGVQIPSLIHPRAFLSPSASIGAGSIVEACAVVQSGSDVGRGCFIRSNACVYYGVQMGHGCDIGCGSTIEAESTMPPFSKLKHGEVHKKELEPRLKLKDVEPMEGYSFEVGM